MKTLSDQQQKGKTVWVLCYILRFPNEEGEWPTALHRAYTTETEAVEENKRLKNVYHILMPSGRPVKQRGKPGAGKDGWFYGNYEESARRWSSDSPQRREWSAMIAKIPLPLSRHIAATFRPEHAHV